MEDEIHLLNDSAIYYDAAERIGADAILEPADPRRYDSEDTPAPLKYNWEPILRDGEKIGDMTKVLTSFYQVSYGHCRIEEAICFSC